MRYIELNPVRAGMTDDPAHYRWSSYRSNGLGQTTELISALLKPPRTNPPASRAHQIRMF
jgi:hypothetical protein